VPAAAATADAAAHVYDSNYPTSDESDDAHDEAGLVSILSAYAIPCFFSCLLLLNSHVACIVGNRFA
jgi:hypothetical protein